MPLYCSQDNNVLKEAILCCPRWSSYPGFFSFLGLMLVLFPGQLQMRQRNLWLWPLKPLSQLLASTVRGLQPACSRQHHVKYTPTSDWSTCCLYGGGGSSLELAVQKSQITRWQENFPGYLLVWSWGRAQQLLVGLWPMSSCQKNVTENGGQHCSKQVKSPEKTFLVWKH